ncbi:MAG: M56 family metallopeptidase, partial [Ignavibacteria bacterium]|nr:M56 family metallopeptidase [Ignavibacteria bacterium]
MIYVLADSQFGLDELIANLDAFLLLAAPKVFWFWLLGMLIMSIRLSGGYFVAYRLKNKSVKNVPNDWQERLNQLAVQMKIKRKIRFLESARIDVPMVIGYLKPILIVPLGTLARIPFDELEMILAHELAHIKRADFLVNILQSIVETLLFFNPFVWYLSAIIRQERENICDDMALQTTGHKLSLAKALVSISSNPKEVQYNSILYFNKFNTMKRIERLFNNPRLKPSPTEKMTVTVLSLVFVLFISTSVVLTGSNVSDNLNDVVSNIWKSNSEMATDTIKNAVTSEKKTKEVEVEVVNGKTVKMTVDGVEVPTEQLENEEYTWVDNDTTLTKKITIRNGEGKHKTMVIKSDAVKVHQRDDGSYEYEFVTNGSGPEKEVHIIKKVGKGEGAKTEAFIWTSDNDSNNASSGNGNKKKVYFISNDGDKMEMDEQMIWVEAEALGKEAERIKLEMKSLDPNNQENMDRLAAELEALEAENIAMEHEFN